MAEQVAGIKGRFLMSINDNPEVQTLLGVFNLTPGETSYTIANGANGTKAAQLLVSNFKFRARSVSGLRGLGSKWLYP